MYLTQNADKWPIEKRHEAVEHAKEDRKNAENEFKEAGVREDKPVKTKLEALDRTIITIHDNIEEE